MPPFLCFTPDHGHTIDDAERVPALDAEEAAELYVERHFSDWDCPTESVIHVASVQAPGDGPRLAPQIFDVTVEPIPHFSARLREVKGT